MAPLSRCRSSFLAYVSGSQASHLERHHYASEIVLTAVNRLCRAKPPVSQRAEFCKQLSVSSSSLRTLTYSRWRDYSSYIHLWYLADANVDFASDGQGTLVLCAPFDHYVCGSLVGDYLTILIRGLFLLQMEFRKLDSPRFSLPTALIPAKVLKEPQTLRPTDAQRPSPLRCCCYHRPSACLTMKKKKAQNTSGRVLNCSSLSLRRDGGLRRMSLGPVPLSESQVVLASNEESDWRRCHGEMPPRSRVLIFSFTGQH